MVDPAAAGVVARPQETADALADSIAVLAESDLNKSQRKQALGRFAGALRSRGVSEAMNPRTVINWISDAVDDVVPHLLIRDRATLREHFPGLDDMEIADRLVRNASISTAAIGAVSGGVAAVEWVATPSLVTAPVLLAVETVAVVSVEIKLIGELHELYGQPVEGSTGEKTVALMHSWAQRRGVNPLVPGSVAAVMGTAARKELRDRLIRRFGRNLTSLGPLLTGAAIASIMNRSATRALAGNIRDDLYDHKVIEG
jgi:hypothetical protein